MFGAPRKKHDFYFFGQYYMYEIDYKCESCGKSFSESGSLKRHIHAIHEDLRDHKCDICEETFSKTIDLKEHILHEKHKDLLCDICDKLFQKTNYLRQHMIQIHSINLLHLH